MPRCFRSHRWRTRFGSWVQSYTVSGIARALASAGDPICTETVYKWVSGASVPRPDRAVAMVRIAAGAITMDDVYSHRAALAASGSTHGSDSTGTMAR
jgi:hypothetical protein